MAINEATTISACLIVKNEEELLPQCLDSIKELADEIILVDTGSTDGTIAIAEQYKCKIFKHDWQDDFSEARNFSIEQATSDWILWIDADEKLETDDIPIIREAVEREDINSIIVYMLSETFEGWACHQLDKLFRRGTAHFENIVHNQLITLGSKVLTGARIYHYGYSLSSEKMAAKHARTESLLKKQLEENPNSTYALRNLIRTYRAQGKYGEVIKAATRFNQLKSTPLSYQIAMTDLIDAYVKTNRYEFAEIMADTVLEQHPSNIDVTYYLAEIYQKQGKYKSAIEYYKKYLGLMDSIKHKPQADPIIIDTWGLVARAYNNIGTSYFELGEYKKVLKHFRVAVKLDKNTSTYHDNLQATFPKIADGDSINILFLQLVPCMRNRKQAIALRKLGHYVTLAYVDHDRYEDEDVYDETVKVTDYEQLWELCDRHDVVHVHNEPDNLTAMIAEYRPDVILVHDTHDMIQLRRKDNPYVNTVAAIANHRATARVYSTPQQLIKTDQMYNIGKDQSIVLYNFAAESDIPDERLPRLSDTDEEFHIVYQGGLGRPGHRDVADIFKEIANHKIHVHIYSAFDAPEYARLAEASLYLHYHDPVPPSKLIKQMSQYDAGIIPWNLEKGNKEFLDTCIANKLFEYLAAGLPVISCRTAALDWIIVNQGLGMIYDTVNDIVNGIEELKQLDVSDKVFTMENQIGVLVGLYRMLLQDRQEQPTARELIEQQIDELCRIEYENQKLRKNERPVEYRFVFDALAALSPETILDIGTGRTALPHLMHTCGYNVTAIDNWRDYWRNRPYNRHWHVIDDDIQNPVNLDGNRFDFITCVSVLEHIDEHEVAMRNMFKLLNPGGYIALTVPYNESEYVDNIYDNPDVERGNIYYKCQIFSRSELDKWLQENHGKIIIQEYWNVFEKGLWTFGKRLNKPQQVDIRGKHDLSCILIQKEVDNEPNAN